MEEQQLRLLEKPLMTKFFLFWAKKAIFSQKMEAPSKKGYSPKYVYWYQCFSVWKMVGGKRSVHGRHNAFAIPYSHCLCMWVKNEEWLPIFHLVCYFHRTFYIAYQCDIFYHIGSIVWRPSAWTTLNPARLNSINFILHLLYIHGFIQK